RAPDRRLPPAGGGQLLSAPRTQGLLCALSTLAGECVHCFSHSPASLQSFSRQASKHPSQHTAGLRGTSAKMVDTNGARLVVRRHPRTSERQMKPWYAI